MSRFGIRRRLARALLGAPPEPVEEETWPITFALPDGSRHEVQARARYTLSMASQVLETPIDTPCNEGECGACAVQILDGAGLTPPNDAERALMDKHPRGLKFAPDDRLAAQVGRLPDGGHRQMAPRLWNREGGFHETA